MEDTSTGSPSATDITVHPQCHAAQLAVVGHDLCFASEATVPEPPIPRPLNPLHIVRFCAHIASE